ncbi:RNA polymerase III transcription repressor MAF1 [Cryptosporidium felis]|nr:RNA polymerase III transcription repressor MAF1 [Cryptosporidium felis]
MRFIEHSGLNRISVLLNNLDVGDRILNGKLELFTCSEKVVEECDLSERVDREVCVSPQWISHSPIGPVQRQDVRELLVNLISTMNQCFPDYEFSLIKPDNLFKEKDFSTVYNNINYHLSSIVERIYPGFLLELWGNIRDAVEMKYTDIYSYRLMGDDELSPFLDDRSLFSFDYFFYDTKYQRILFFACTTKSKMNSRITSKTLSNSQESNSEDDEDESD